MRELLALRDGVKVIESHNLLPVEINIDSLKVIYMFMNGTFTIIPLLMIAGQD